jgi:hypothetical protein
MYFGQLPKAFQRIWWRLPKVAAKNLKKSLEIRGIMAFLGGEYVNFLQFGHLEQVALACFWEFGRGSWMVLCFIVNV